MVQPRPTNGSAIDNRPPVFRVAPLSPQVYDAVPLLPQRRGALGKALPAGPAGPKGGLLWGCTVACHAVCGGTCVRTVDAHAHHFAFRLPHVQHGDIYFFEKDVQLHGWDDGHGHGHEGEASHH